MLNIYAPVLRISLNSSAFSKAYTVRDLIYDLLDRKKETREYCNLILLTNTIQIFIYRLLFNNGFLGGSDGMTTAM